MKSLFARLNAALIKNLNKAGVYSVAGHFIMTASVKPGGCVIDLGANKGVFYNKLQADFNCQCYAIEASPALADALPVKPGINTFNYAVSNTNGFVNLHLSNEPEANSLQPVIAANWGISNVLSVPSITLDKFLDDQKITGLIDVLKIDIEGAEVDVINATTQNTFAKVKQIPVEFHDFLNTDAEYRSAMNNCLKKLKEINFLVLRLSSYDNREVLCINKKLVKLSTNQYIRLTIIHPMLRSFKLLHSGLNRLSSGK